MKAQAVVLGVFLIALTQVLLVSSKCSNQKRFLKCIRADTDRECEKIQRDGQKRMNDGKRKISQCFRQAGCKAPSEKNDDADGEDKNMPAQVRAIKECLEGAKERVTVQIKSKIEKCMGEKLPDHMEGPCGKGDHSEMMKRMKKAGKAMCDAYMNCDKQADVKECVEGEIDSQKEAIKEEFQEKCVNRGLQIYYNLCGVPGLVNTCELRNSGCTQHFKDKRSKFCECRSEIGAEFRATVKAEIDSCISQAGGSVGGGFGAIVGNLAQNIKSCIEDNIGDDFGGEEVAVCDDKTCPSSKSAAEQKIKAKCQEIQSKMEAKGEAIKTCIMKDFPAFIQLPGGGGAGSGSFLDKCGAANSFFAGANGGSAGDGGANGGNGGGGILGKLQGLLGGKLG